MNANITVANASLAQLSLFRERYYWRQDDPGLGRPLHALWQRVKSRWPLNPCVEGSSLAPGRFWRTQTSEKSMEMEVNARGHAHLQGSERDGGVSEMVREARVLNMVGGRWLGEDGEGKCVVRGCGTAGHCGDEGDGYVGVDDVINDRAVMISVHATAGIE